MAKGGGIGIGGNKNGMEELNDSFLFCGFVVSASLKVPSVFLCGFMSKFGDGFKFSWEISFCFWVSFGLSLFLKFN